MRCIKHLRVGALTSFASLLAVPVGALANGPEYACTGLPAAAPAQQDIDLAARAETTSDLARIATELEWGHTGYHRDWRTAAALHHYIMERTERFPEGTLGSARWAAASESLITMYSQGLFGLGTNFSEAFRILRLSQSRGRDVAALSATALALQSAEADYLQGLNFIRQGSYDQGLKKLRSASEAGLIRARTSLVEILTYGPAVTNHEEAMSWASRGDNMDFPLISDAAAELLLAGRTSRGRNPAYALSFRYSAARTGYPPAMYGMGVAFENGIGTGRNLNEAMCWFRRALQYGSGRTIDDAQGGIARLRARGVS